MFSKNWCFEKWIIFNADEKIKLKSWKTIINVIICHEYVSHWKRIFLLYECDVCVYWIVSFFEKILFIYLTTQSKCFILYSQFFYFDRRNLLLSNETTFFKFCQSQFSLNLLTFNMSRCWDRTFCLLFLLSFRVLRLIVLSSRVANNFHYKFFSSFHFRKKSFNWIICVDFVTCNWKFESRLI